MLLTTSSTGDKPKATPFYYITHPYEAYVEGYNTYLGQINNNRQTFDAYSYYLPMAVVKLIPVINEYFEGLITGNPLPPECQRRKSYLASIDTAVGVLSRIAYMNKIGNQIAVGSRYIKPITWAVFGEGTPSCKMYKYQFYTVESVIEHYIRRYEQKTHCQPVCVYHTQDGRGNIGKIAGTGGAAKFSENAVIAAAVHLMYDMLQHGGPDVTEFFDLYTNDLTCSPDDVDLSLWRKCREAALCSDMRVRETPAQTRALVQPSTFYGQSPVVPQKPMKINVTITDEGDDLSEGCKMTKFQSIIITTPDRNFYTEYYY